MTPERIAKLRALCEATWCAPWVAHTFEIDCPCPNDQNCGYMHTCEEVEAPEAYPDGQCVVQISVPGLETFSKPTAEFIAAARTALPELLDEVERLRDKMKRQRHKDAQEMVDRSRKWSGELVKLKEERDHHRETLRQMETMVAHDGKYGIGSEDVSLTGARRILREREPWLYGDDDDA